MNVMWLHSHLSYWGGGTKFVFNVIKNLSKYHKITIFVEKADDEIKKKFSEFVDVKVLSSYSTGNTVFWLNFNKQLQKEINDLQIYQSNFDLVISSMFPMNVIANKLNLPHIQYCFEPFAFFHDDFMINNLPPLRKLFLKIMKKKFLNLDVSATKKSTIILTVNSGTRQWIQKIYERDATPTLLGVDTNFFRKITDEKLQKQFSGKKIIVHSTDWTPLKRTNWLIDVFTSLSDDDILLLITEVKTVGKEKEIALKKIRENSIKNIKFCGMIPNEILPNYYSLANLAVYCGEGQGASAASLFVLECMSCETPVIRTNDTLEEITHNQNGFLFDKNDEESFKKFLRVILSDESIQKKFGINARHFIEKNYSWDKVTTIFNENINSLVSKS